jgi:hypothetical protein
MARAARGREVLRLGFGGQGNAAMTIIMPAPKTIIFVDSRDPPQKSGGGPHKTVTRVTPERNNQLLAQLTERNNMAVVAVEGRIREILSRLQEIHCRAAGDSQ